MPEQEKHLNHGGHEASPGPVNGLDCADVHVPHMTTPAHFVDHPELKVIFGFQQKKNVFVFGDATRRASWKRTKPPSSKL